MASAWHNATDPEETTSVQMKNSFTIPTLGTAHIETPFPSAFFVNDEAGVLVDAVIGPGRSDLDTVDVLEKAGPRKKIFFDPTRSTAAVVTCGGLCPGLNDAVRSLTMVLWYRYGVRSILGLRYGYEGLVSAIGHEPMTLTPEAVEDIHQDGGTILGSSRGPQSPSDMVDFLEKRSIDMLFTIGGDGTQRGAVSIVREIERRKLPVAVVGIPKTIDNDISFTQRSFGFETAVAMSQAPITCAHMEAKGVRNGIGLVKLMGRASGFVAAYATLASSDVNLLLIPEVPFSMEKVLAYLEQRFQNKAHAVIVVAEGAGQDLVPSSGKDASGNQKLGDVGEYLKQAIGEYFSKREIETHVKYIDPSYTIRSAPANADDSVFCFQLAENAVHAAMAGRTAMVLALWNGHFVHVPMQKAVGSRKKVSPDSSLWQSVLDNTGQPADLQ